MKSTVDLSRLFAVGSLTFFSAYFGLTLYCQTRFATFAAQIAADARPGTGCLQVLTEPDIQPDLDVSLASLPMSADDDEAGV